MSARTLNTHFFEKTVWIDSWWIRRPNLELNLSLKTFNSNRIQLDSKTNKISIGNQ